MKHSVTKGSIALSTSSISRGRLLSVNLDPQAFFTEDMLARQEHWISIDILADRASKFST
jgi:hypothetical protein